MKPIPAVLVDRFEQPVKPMPVIVYQFLISNKRSTIAVVATPAGTFRTADLDELTWTEMTDDTPVTTDFHEAVVARRGWGVL